MSHYQRWFIVSALCSLAITNAFIFSSSSHRRRFWMQQLHQTASEVVFEDFATFLHEKQQTIIHEICETIEASSGATFSEDKWGSTVDASGGITRVLQGGDAIEKGACSLTVIRQGSLTADRAATIRARQSSQVKEGNSYAAAALSMVLHSRNPFVPTFRSDIRIFLAGSDFAWFGGGADLTPYYLDRDDISSFHQMYRNLCVEHEGFEYEELKTACDDYFYLPARNEHRGTGGIFFDDRVATEQSMKFVKDVANTWMPSWIPIVQKHNTKSYTEQQKHWQKLRRGRYLEFNLLYDRGVKFGLQTTNPRVEGVMVSAPPEIAYEYRHEVEPGSPEAELVEVLRRPASWVQRNSLHS